MEITRTKRAGILLVAGIVAIMSIAATTGNLEWTQLRSDNRRGSTAGAIGQSACGSTTNGHMGTFDSTGCLVDGGAPGGSGVSSIGVSVPTGFTVSGSPVTSSGTITIGYASSLTTHQVLGTGSSGALALVNLTGADLPNPSGSTLGGVQSIAAVSHNFLDSISTSGVPHASQPAFTDISGTVAASQLPTPTTSTFGGIEDIAAVAHKWIDSIVSGVPHLSQPAESDLSVTDITTNNVSTSAHGFAPKAPNDATKFLDGTGAYSSPIGTGLAGMVLLEQHAASTSNELDFITCISSSYDEYRVDLNALTVDVAGATMTLQVGTAGGYDSTAGHYAWGRFTWDASGATGGAGGGSATYINLAPVQATTTNQNINGVFHIFGPASSVFKSINGMSTNFQNGGTYLGTVVTGFYIQTSTFDRFRIIPTSGHIVAGTARCYGMAK